MNEIQIQFLLMLGLVFLGVFIFYFLFNQLVFFYGKMAFSEWQKEKIFYNNEGIKKDDKKDLRSENEKSIDIDGIERLDQSNEMNSKNEKRIVGLAIKENIKGKWTKYVIGKFLHNLQQKGGAEFLQQGDGYNTAMEKAKEAKNSSQFDGFGR